MNVPMERVVLMLRTYGMLEIGDVPTSDLVMRLTPSDIINRETKKTKYLRNSSFRERVLLFSIISKRRLTNAATKLQKNTEAMAAQARYRLLFPQTIAIFAGEFTKPHFRKPCI